MKQPRRIFIFAMLAFILFDLAWNFAEYYNQPLQGDIIPLVLPDERNAPVLSDPFGFKALASGEFHPNINRFFCNFTLYGFFRSVPFVLQKVVHPVESLYLGSTLFKFLLLLGFWALMVKFIIGSTKFFQDILLASFIVLPFFQSSGWLSSIEPMGVSIVYIFFYSFPFFLLLLLLYGIFWSTEKTDQYFKLKLLAMVGLIIVCAFSSALMPAVVLIGGGLYFLHFIFQQIKERQLGIKYLLSKMDWRFYLISLFFILSLYSFFLGSFNPESVDNPSLSEKYEKLFSGLFSQLIQKPGPTILWLIALVNFSIIRYFKIPIESKSVLPYVNYAIFFTVVYIFLLPLGGFREYRPDILRSDTLLPIALMWMIIVGASSYLIIKHLPKYTYLFLGIVILFSHHEYAKGPSGKECEEAALYQLSESSSDIINLEAPCRVMAWVEEDYPEWFVNHSKLWQYWNITEGRVLVKMPKKEE